MVRTASNGYFPMVISALSVPDPANELFDDVRHVEQQLKGLGPDLLRANLQQAEAYRPLVEKYDIESIVAAFRATLGREGRRASSDAHRRVPATHRCTR